jgi:hypothetical protein
MKYQLFLYAILLPVQLLAQDVLWTKSYGTTAADGAKSICIANDPGYVAAGYSFFGGSKISKAFVIKINESGDEIWRSLLDLPGSKYANDICRLHDNNGYMICGKSQETDQLLPDLWIAKIDNTGTLIWSKTIGGTGVDVGEAVCSSSDGNYIVCGTTSSKGHGAEDMYALKIDGDGTVVWEKTFGGVNPDSGADVIETSDGYYLFGGSTGTYDNTVSNGRNRDMYVVKTNAGGEAQTSAAIWVMASSQGAYDACNSLCELADGDYAMIGVCSQEGVEALDIGVVRLTRDLAPIWKKNIEVGTFFDFGYAICVYTSDNGLLVGGLRNYNNKTDSDGVLIKMDAGGQLDWKVGMGENPKEGFQSVVSKGDGNYLLAGYTYSAEPGDMNFWLMDFSENASGIGINPDQDLIDFRVWPNPADEILTVSALISGPGFVQVCLTDFSGRLLKDNRIKSVLPGQFQKSFDITDLPSGTYLCTINCNGNKKTMEVFVK